MPASTRRRPRIRSSYKASSPSSSTCAFFSWNSSFWKMVVREGRSCTGVPSVHEQALGVCGGWPSPVASQIVDGREDAASDCQKEWTAEQGPPPQPAPNGGVLLGGARREENDREADFARRATAQASPLGNQALSACSRLACTTGGVCRSSAGETPRRGPFCHRTMC